MSDIVVGLDIGGTKTEALVMDRTLRVRGQAVRPTVTSSADAMVQGILDTIYEALATLSSEPYRIEGIGVGIPGRVLPETGDVQMAVNLRLEAYPLGRTLAARLNAPVYVENDVRLAALATYHRLREQQPIHSLAYLSIGTGIAAGLVLDGKLYRGAHGMAGEIGHIAIDENGAACICGQAGCLEAVAGGPAIARQALLAGLELGDGAAQEVFAIARGGDARAQSIVQRVGRYIARAVQWIVMTYDVEKVVMGGGVTSAGTTLLDTVLGELAVMRSQSDLNRMMLPDSKLSLLPGDFSAGARGAIRMAQQALDASTGVHTVP